VKQNVRQVRILLKTILTAGLLWFFLGLSSSASGYEDKPFEFEAVVHDSILLVIRGVEYREFKLTYNPGDYELFINGNPIFGHGNEMDSGECADLFVGVESAQAKIQEGVPCETIKRWYNSQKNEVLWAGARLIEKGQKESSNLRLTLELVRVCQNSPIAQDINGALVLNGVGFVEFEGIRYSSRRPTRVPLAADWDMVGTSRIPFGEMALRFSKNLVKRVNSAGRASRIIALGPGGGGKYGSGVGLVSRGRAQLEEIKRQGKYVKGPVPQSTFR